MYTLNNLGSVGALEYMQHMNDPLEGAGGLRCATFDAEDTKGNYGWSSQPTALVVVLATCIAASFNWFIISSFHSNFLLKNGFVL